MNDGLEVGKATPEEVAALHQIQKKISESTMQLGNLEMQKRKVGDHILGLEQQAAELLQQIGQRENVPQGHDWFLDEDGTIRVRPRAAPPGQAPKKEE